MSYDVIIGERWTETVGEQTNIREISTPGQNVDFFPLPQKTTTERDAIENPEKGFAVFNTTTNDVDVYNGTAWKSLAWALL